MFSATALILIYAACLYFIIPPLALQKAKAVAAQKGYGLKVSGWNSSGFNNIFFNSLLVIDARGDTILAVNHGNIGYSVFRYLTGKFPVDKISLDSLLVLKKPESRMTALSASKEPKTKTGLSSRLFSIERRINHNLPEQVTVNHAVIIVQKNKPAKRWSVDDFKWNNSSMQGWMKTDEGAEIALHANINNKISNTSEFSVTMNNNRFIPATVDSNALLFSFMTASVSLQKVKWSKSEIAVHCSLKAEGLQLYHWRISQDTIKINRFEADQQAIINEDSITIAPKSSFLINDIRLNTGAKMERKKNLSFSMKAVIPLMPSQAFFNSLPEGLFQSFKGIKTEGEIGYALNFSVDLSMPDSLIFESTFNGRSIKIRKFGEVNPYRLHDPFEHTVYEKGRPLRKIMVGSENPHFVHYSQIPPALVNCVLTAEDGSFFSHAGFNEESFRQSIITNIKEKRFARGGSTISMQLVKNLYLGRDKNISRKMEEALWVWLIENKRMVTKERMMEIYLNIIEWGPDVYGIGEAAQYYFSKKPAQLSLNECIFLAGIIPNPKYFRYAFDKEGNLRNYFQSFFKIVSERLLMKEKITQEEFSTVNPLIRLTGRAALLITPSDSLPDFNAEEAEEERP